MYWGFLKLQHFFYFLVEVGQSFLSSILPRLTWFTELHTGFCEIPIVKRHIEPPTPSLVNYQVDYEPDQHPL
jgi:hypothetical protein